jgi:hypothetical protein
MELYKLNKNKLNENKENLKKKIRENKIEKNIGFNEDNMGWSEEQLKTIKKFENNLKESFKSEHKEPKIKNLNFIKKNNTNDFNTLKNCSLIIKDKDINNLNNGEEVDIIYNIYPEIKQWIKTFPENKKSLKIGKAMKKYNKLRIYMDGDGDGNSNGYGNGNGISIGNLNITIESIPKICTISDTFFDKILKNLSDYKKAV